MPGVVSVIDAVDKIVGGARIVVNITQHVYRLGICRQFCAFVYFASITCLEQTVEFERQQMVVLVEELDAIEADVELVTPSRMQLQLINNCKCIFD